ncbi:VWA domain-containing protein [Corallococcus praedator]|uniref:VWA domain-containing protein n=1 Tax=Corallococcus praedator TaxID=2316724 RepID=A0ABX9QLS3_9BACT|nr:MULTISPECIES: VWA domain-containing protein [Corallococcus]RKH32485.1 VWA domain-containing protein [Corallococcus sp. CA031C]RKI12673.1 VWA domain-containing protein [Corallococcus praedator]
MTTRTQTTLPETQRGPAERLLDVVLGGSAHLWHHRPGLNVSGTWEAAAHAHPQARARWPKVAPGLFVPAAVKLYGQLLELYRLNPTLMAHFASYALTQTDWRDLKVATCALMLVQGHAGLPVRDGQGAVAFHDDDFRAIGEAMVLHYVRRSTRMLTPKAVLRVAELLEVPEIARLNREAGFGDPASHKPPMGRWKSVARKWLAAREANLPMLQGLVKAGYKETLKKLARKAGYKPMSQGFFEVLGWKQKQADGGHRDVGLHGLTLVKRERFDGLSEAEICEWIELERLSYKEVVGRLPKDVGLTPAILATLLPSLSDRDLRLMTPTLEELGLMEEPSVKARWERAVSRATDQRSLNIAKNVRGEDLRRKLEEASDNAARHAVAQATADMDVRVMFLIDKSGSMEGAIEQSKEALSRILAGFPMDKLHVAAFDTMGTVLKPKAANRTAVQHMLADMKASGGTVHGAAVHALHRAGVRIPAEAKLVVMVVGDEAGEAGDQFAKAFHACGYTVAAMAMLVSVAGARGNTVRTGAAQLGVPFSEVSVGQFADPYQVPRVLQTLMDAPRMEGAHQSGWVDRVMSTPLLKVA